MGLGDYAKQRDVRALAIQEREHSRSARKWPSRDEQGNGDEHRTWRALAIKRGNLGNAYGDLGDHAKQRDMLERALAIEERAYGRDHPDVAITLGNLGGAYGDLGDHAKKRDMLERALAIKERAYGRDHPEVAITLGNLGNAYGDLGDQAKKRDVLERALAIKERAYGRDHAQVAITLFNLGMAYGDKRRRSALMERVLPISTTRRTAPIIRIRGIYARAPSPNYGRDQAVRWREWRPRTSSATWPGPHFSPTTNK